MNGPFPDSLIEDWYWIGVVDNYSRYLWRLFMKTKSQLPKKMEEFFDKMMSRGTPVKYPCCDNAGERKSKLQRACEKENMTLEYTTSHTPQMNGVIKIIIAVIKEGALAMFLNAKLNETSQKILWEEAVHMCKRIRNSMANTGSTTSLFENFHGENPKIIGSFLEFVRIRYVTKREIFKEQMTDKTFREIMVLYANNHKRYKYKLYNP